MQTLEILWSWVTAHDWLETFVALLAKGSVLVAMAWLLLRCWPRASAAAKHWVWLLALVGLFLLPLKFSIWPGWSVPLWRQPPAAESANQILSVTGTATGRAASLMLAAEKVEPPATTSQTLPTSQRHRFTVNLSTILFLVWFTVAVILFARSVFARWHLWRLQKLTTPIVTPASISLLHNLSEALGLHQRARLLQGHDALLPMTWGVWHPVILLPSAAETWTEERRRIVLQHELAHVKRRDCLAQSVAQLACAVFWFNPMAWFAARQMRVERERACDDLVLETGAAPSSYAEHLLDIAHTFKMEALTASAAIAIARPSQLAGRITAIIETRNRRGMTTRVVMISLAAAALVLGVLCACHVHARPAESLTAREMEIQFGRLKPFFAIKERQARELLKVEAPTNPPSPLLWNYFAAAANDDWISVTNYYWQMRSRAYQFAESTNADPGLENMAWQPVNETYGILALDLFGNKEDNIAYGRAIIASIPPGSIYFGGTDPGRWIITGMVESHEGADPFFTLSQNPLADGLYLKYLRTMYGSRIYVPTEEDSKKAFDDYTADAQLRMNKGQLRPGENVRMVDGKPKASGQVSVMGINALLAKLIFERNPDREFYIEESFALDWMYPHLTPHGLIMKLNRQPLPEISDEVLRSDRDYWSRYIERFIGDWLRDNTSVAEICRRVEQAYDGKEIMRDSKPPYRVSFPTGLMYSKLRCSIAGVYAWRAGQATTNPAEKERMTREADFAFRQAYALAPHSPEALYRYVQLLATNRRFDDALLLARTSSNLEPGNPGLRNLVRELERMRSFGSPGAAAPAKGIVTGRVVLRGTPPPERLITMDAACAALNPSSVTTRHYVVGENGGLANVFVYAKKGALPGQIAGTRLLAMRRCQFEPYVLGAQVGQLIELHNEDGILDNVHVTPRVRGNRERNVGMPGQGKSAQFSFGMPELFIRVKTDVKPWMYSFICVVDHPWFAATDANGNFTLPPGLLPGHYTLAATHPKAGEQTHEIDVGDNNIHQVNFTLEVPRE